MLAMPFRLQLQSTAVQKFKWHTIMNTPKYQEKSMKRMLAMPFRLQLQSTAVKKIKWHTF